MAEIKNWDKTFLFIFTTVIAIICLSIYLKIMLPIYKSRNIIRHKERINGLINILKNDNIACFNKECITLLQTKEDEAKCNASYDTPQKCYDILKYFFKPSIIIEFLVKIITKKHIILFLCMYPLVLLMCAATLIMLNSFAIKFKPLHYELRMDLEEILVIIEKKAQGENRFPQKKNLKM